MTGNERPLILLGPQPNYESLRTAISDLQLKSPVALITSGWETEENDDHELKTAIGIEAVNLNLFGRTEELFADDADLIQTLQARQDKLRHLRRAYNDRLDHLLKAARQIIRRQESLLNLDPERESAIEMVRQLDRQYFIRTSQILDDYEQLLQTEHRPLVAHHRNEIREQLSGLNAILIAGGHVAIILNRLKIFGILEMRPELPIIAWSGGAMALSDQVVFFHDSPPQGPGNAEVLRAGMGLFHDVLPLPGARSRLKLDDRARVELFARRFDRFQCVIFDEQTMLQRKNGDWAVKGHGQVVQLGKSGSVVDFKS